VEILRRADALGLLRDVGRAAPLRPRLFQLLVEAEQTSVYWGKVYLDDLLFVTVNQDPLIGEAHLHLGHWAPALSSS